MCMYKMFNIDKETYKNSDIERIVDGIGALWLNKKHIEDKLGHKNLPVITSKYQQVYELLNRPKKRPNRRFLRTDLALKVTMNCRTDESCNLKKKKILGFRLQDIINTKEQIVLESIKDAFEGEDVQTQYSVLGYRIDFYFHKHKLAIEVDELRHAGRNLSNETEKQKALEKELDCIVIRTNPDEE